MSFREKRIENDLNAILFPIKMHYEEKEVGFTMKFESTIYKREYTFVVKFPESYPFQSPKVFIKEHIFHPNIFEGKVCLKILKENWQPSYDLNSIITSLVLIFDEPSYEEPYNTEAADLLKYNLPSFLNKVKEVDSFNDEKNLME